MITMVTIIIIVIGDVATDQNDLFFVLLSHSTVKGSVLGLGPFYVGVAHPPFIYMGPLTKFVNGCSSL